MHASQNTITTLYLEAFQELTYLEGIKSHIKDIVEQYQTNYNIDNPQVIIGHLVCFDISGEEFTADIDQYSKIIKPGYIITKDNYIAALNGISDRNAELSVSQAFESFIKFLKKVIVLMCKDNQDLFKQGNSHLRKYVKNNREKFDKGILPGTTYLTFAYAIMPRFQQVLNNNNHHRNYYKYLEVLNFVRNKFSHVDFYFDKEDSELQTMINDEDKLDFMKRLFAFSVSEENAQFQIGYYEATINLQILSAIVFQFYKQVLISLNLRTDWTQPFIL